MEKLNVLLPEKVDLELDRTVPPEEPKQISIDKELKLAESSLSENLFQTQVIIYKLKTNIDAMKSMTELQRNTFTRLESEMAQAKAKVSFDINDAVVSMAYTKPIPIGSKSLWIAKGADINHALEGFYHYEDSKFYLISSSQIVESDRTGVLYQDGRQRVGDLFIRNYIGLKSFGIDRNVRLSINGNTVVIDPRYRPLVDLSTHKLIAGHKALVGGFLNDLKEPTEVQGQVSLASSLHSDFLESFNQVSEKEEECRNIASLDDDEFKTSVLDLFVSDSPVLGDLRLDSETVEELSSLKPGKNTFLEDIKRFSHSISKWSPSRHHSTGQIIHLIKKDDFLRLFSPVESFTLVQKIAIQRILGFNLEESKNQIEREIQKAYANNIVAMDQVMQYSSEIEIRISEKRKALQALLGDSVDINGVNISVDNYRYDGDIVCRNQDDDDLIFNRSGLIKNTKTLSIPAKQTHVLLQGLESNAEPLTPEQRLAVIPFLDKKIYKLGDGNYELVRRYKQIEELNAVVDKMRTLLV